MNQWRVNKSLIGILLAALSRLLVALSSIEVGHDERRLVILHLRRCQALLVAPQISRFGHLNDGDLLGAAHLPILLVGGGVRLAIRRANTLRQALLHDAALAIAAVCILARFYFRIGRGMECGYESGSHTRVIVAPTSTRFARLLLDSSCQHKYRLAGDFVVVADAERFAALVL